MPFSQTEANTDVLASLHDSQKLDYCIYGLSKTKKNVKFQLINVLRVLKIMHMGKMKVF